MSDDIDKRNIYIYILLGINIIPLPLSFRSIFFLFKETVRGRAQQAVQPQQNNIKINSAKIFSRRSYE